MRSPVTDRLAGIPVAAGTRLLEPLAFGLQWEAYRAEADGKRTVLLRFMPAPFRTEWDIPGTIDADAAGDRYASLANAVSDSLFRISSGLPENASLTASDGALWYAPGTLAPFETMPRDADGVLQAIERVAQSLRRLHREGAIHGDVHPDFINLRLGKRCLIGVGTDVRALGGDFGSNDRLGRRGYSPPEQWDATGDTPLGPWTDIHALAATLYGCLTGEAPPDFRERRRSPEQTSQTICEEIAGAFGPGDPRSPRIADAVLWALTPHIGDRPWDVMEWYKTLAPEPAPSLPTTPSIEELFPEQQPAAAPRRRTAAFAAIPLLFLLGAGGYFGYRALSSPRAPAGSMAAFETAKAPRPAARKSSTAATAPWPRFDGRWHLATDPNCERPRAISIDGDSLTMQIGNVTIVEVIVRRSNDAAGVVTYAPNLDASYEFIPFDGRRRLRMTALKQNTSEVWFRCS